MTTNVYVLRLEGGNYYVGKSDNVMSRYQQHLNGSGSAWTRKHKPLALQKTYENVSPFQEDAITKMMMSNHGLDKVRGGSYCEIELSKVQIDTINKEIWGAKDYCSQCGRKGHWFKDCYAKKDASGNTIWYGEEHKDDEDDDEDELEWCCDYCDRTFTTAFGCGVHEKSCKEKAKPKPKPKSKPTATAKTCYRCGREGHYSPDCYARTHTKGYTLDSDDDSDDEYDSD